MCVCVCVCVCVALLCAASSTVLCSRQMYKLLHRLLLPQRYLHLCRCCLFRLGVSHAPHLIPHYLDLQEMAARASVAERLVVISPVLGMPFIMRHLVSQGRSQLLALEMQLLKDTGPLRLPRALTLHARQRTA